jgi:hypothetical protein
VKVEDIRMNIKICLKNGGGSLKGKGDQWKGINGPNTLYSQQGNIEKTY